MTKQPKMELFINGHSVGLFDVLSMHWDPEMMYVITQFGLYEQQLILKDETFYSTTQHSLLTGKLK